MQADVDAAVKALEAKGIRDVGVVSPKDYAITPGGGSAYVLVSGAFAKRGAATKALRALRRRAPGAAVIEVRSKDSAAAKGSNKVLSKTRYGSAHQLEGSTVTQKDLADSKKAIDHIVHSKGKAYVEGQRNLPDQIVVP
jgi:hypothetical protein